MEVTQPRRVVVATGNAHKVTELRNILAPWLQEIELVSGAEFAVPEPVEDGTTFAQNALIKARAYARATGLPAIADDSGLCVDILGGAPGIFSARWSGHHGDDAANRHLLLAQLADVGPANRGAHFHCAAALVTPEGREEVREGEMPGSLLTVERGSGGFGYDPIFAPAGSSRSNAELSPEEKDAISHRGKAFAQLAPVIVQVLAERN
ncbi:RdgB/HAM1 family non-canonical purine NTP pyrophosphatase [Actinotignum schaalii]|uniref:RdgB/HAM1 family non-canonical purine NTP pyrophosphatase n=1 Tax=Actinotignum schaalii TaxID=59505 RepID=UPI00041A6A8A|nr:RdgB/HAM1 family non-canonical purine NTP pyrophosphatase [Actinotignum schaalii]AIE82413.1 nucleoside-triphosphate diphosphatase [Actinotignum schaalii]WQN44459.1 RdgB/HAM1 family non-canonical purine NTP pyrophosphatase [Actinotignum schaalii]